ncbi:MAG: NPCBM/NEW2 domain-containing protein [Saprospiraceae bacterium]|nr:NPCBM/NEW2 domain-containing protein [Saprospiraceae bacterium]MBP8095663.1 NPCBM/NEW2 domain-containing protein [Saprospiraceae bacterium]
MNFKHIQLIIVFYLINIVSLFAQTPEVWLDELPIRSFSGGIPSVGTNTNQSGDSIKIGGHYFKRGIGVQSTSVISFLLNGHAASFSAMVGVDDKANSELHYNFYVIGDRKILFESKNRIAGSAPEPVSVDLTGINRLGLLVTISESTTSRSYTNWAMAKFIMMGDHQPMQLPNDDEKYILTPPPPLKPKINSAKIVGASPGNPFLYTIAATGKRPIKFSSKRLPQGLSLNKETGIISGKVKNKGEYITTIQAKNTLGKATASLRIKIGDTISLTPPIGWNGWNSWARDIDQEKVVASANAMVNMGLSQHGWTYINIDDAWQGQRAGAFNAIQPNEKFPKFKQMTDYIHSLGLKVGIYSTPMITSYAGYVGGTSDFENGDCPDSIIKNKRAFRYIGKYHFETNDAQQMAAWGIDYLKYDWRIEVPSAERMSVALKNSGRDIVYSISNSAPFSNAGDWMRLTNTWRTGPDIRDSWLSLYISAFTLDKWAPYAGPGHWNDPDMLILGNVTTGTPLHPTRLTPDEQYSHVSIYCLLAAPLLIGCPIEQLDPFTLNLLTNDEVIAIDQDPLGKPGRLLVDEEGVQTWVKPLEDGSYAVGLFYTDDFGKTPQSYIRWGDEKAISYKFDFEKTGLHGQWKFRDLWSQSNLGIFKDSFNITVRHHGVVLYRMSPVK